MNTTIDVLLLVLKYTGSILAGAYGVYVTITDFHERRGNEKVLSTKGKVGIVLLLCSILLNISADGTKDLKERKEAAIAKAKQDEAVRAELAMLELTRQINTQLGVTAAPQAQCWLKLAEILIPFPNPTDSSLN